MKDRRRCFGKMQMEEKQHLLIRKGREVRIGPYEFEVLFYMLEHIGAVVSREEKKSMRLFLQEKETVAEM